MSESLDIVKLIDANPIIRLSGHYQHKMLCKIQEKFSGIEQQLFIASFYCYLNYNNRTDYVIDLDTIWKWLGFSQKVRAKELLEKHFNINKDYKIERITSDFLGRETHPNGGGLTFKDKITLTIRTFKSFCLKANTKKAKEIHEYYLNLEEVLQETLDEESNELRRQLSTTQEKLSIAESRVQQRHKINYNPGKALYILTSKNHPDHFKLGHTCNLEKRLSYYQTGSPDQSEFSYHKFWYSEVAYELEQLLLRYFKLDRKNMNSEWIYIDKLDSLVEIVQSMLVLLPSNNDLVIKTREIVTQSPQKINSSSLLINCLNCNSPTTKNIRRKGLCKECEELQCKKCNTRIPRKLLNDHTVICGIILQINPETFKIINEWESMELASKETGIAYKLIRDTCNCSKRTTGGFIWLFKNKIELQKKYFKDFTVNSELPVTDELLTKCLDPENIEYNLIKPVRSNSAIKHCKKICQINNETFEEHIWDSTVAASKATGIDKSSIIRCCKGKQKTAGNNNWIYV